MLVILHENHAQGGGDDEVLVAVVIEVDKKSGLGLEEKVSS